MKPPYKYFILTVVLVIIDQAIKMWMQYDVLPNHYGNLPVVADIFDFHYVLNPGMAFGMELGGDYGKLFLSIFRLLATLGIGYYIVHLSRKDAHVGLLWSVAAILGGALGNVIDSTFYGVFIEGNVIANSSTPWFHGQVIDMFYLEVFDGFWPEWIPVWGGSYNSTPIFNFADASIFCGVTSIILFQKSFLDPVEPTYIEDATEINMPSPEDQATLEIADDSEDMIDISESRIIDSENSIANDSIEPNKPNTDSPETK
jgi:signal peptidase II